MHKGAKISIFILRFLTGWFFLYAGISKILNPNWSAAGFLESAKTFPEIYTWFLQPANITWVNLLNEWGLALIGIALIFGMFTRLASIAGILLMILYYFPGLDFPYAGSQAFIVDSHILYIASLFVLIKTRAGHFWGWDGRRGYH
jgi:thiosulfate dehydrogenase (quinone) large subunit